MYKLVSANIKFDNFYYKSVTNETANKDLNKSHCNFYPDFNDCQMCRNAFKFKSQGTPAKK